MKLLALLPLLLLSFSAWAATAIWTYPAPAPSSFRLRIGTSSGSYSMTNTIPGTATNFVVTLPPGTYFGSIVAVVTNGAGVGPAGIEGAASNEIQFTVPEAPVLKIQSSLESAPSPAGPWQSVTNYEPVIISLEPGGPARFYRGSLLAKLGM